MANETVTVPEDKVINPTTRVVAADGGSPATTTKVLAVKTKGVDADGNEVEHDAIINADDFDAEIHTKADPKAKPERPRLRLRDEESPVDDNDLKELGPAKTKAEKDALEAAASAQLGKGKSAAAVKEEGRKPIVEAPKGGSIPKSPPAADPKTNLDKETAKK